MIYVKLIIVFTPNYEFFLILKLYVEVQHSSYQRLTKVKEKWSAVKVNVFVFSFLFFIQMFQTLSVKKRSDMCYFLHASNSWCICWRVHVQLRTSNGEDWPQYTWIVHIKSMCSIRRMISAKIDCPLWYHNLWPVQIWLYK